jgi:hypothetical protein
MMEKTILWVEDSLEDVQSRVICDRALNTTGGIPKDELAPFGQTRVEVNADVPVLVLYIFLEEKEGVVVILINDLVGYIGILIFLGDEALQHLDAMFLGTLGAEGGSEPDVLGMGLQLAVVAVVRAGQDQVTSDQRACTPLLRGIGFVEGLELANCAEGVPVYILHLDQCLLCAIQRLELLPRCQQILLQRGGANFGRSSLFPKGSEVVYSRLPGMLGVEGAH